MLAFQVWDDPDLLRGQNPVTDELGRVVTPQQIIEQIEPWYATVLFVWRIKDGMVHLTLREYEELPCVMEKVFEVYHNYLNWKKQHEQPRT